jgi:hypothetical protein
MEVSTDRAVRNEVLFREVNRQVEELAGRMGRAKTIAFVCECCHGTCLEGIEVELDEYRRVRSHPLWFFVKPGHEEEKVERVVERHSGYLVVEKDGAVPIA